MRHGATATSSRSSIRLTRLRIVVRCHHFCLLVFLCDAFNLAFPAAALGVAPFRAEQGFYRLATDWTAFARQTQMAGPFMPGFHWSVSFVSLSTTSLGPSASMSRKAQAAS